jgi:penicillin-binding protein 1C
LLFSFIALVLVFGGGAGFALKTWLDLRPLPGSLTLAASDVRKVQILDRRGTPLTITYQNRWNIHDYVELYKIPQTLQQAFVEAEDRRFYWHKGPDWLARAHALVQNVKALSTVRGASTITEQVIRMLHPRPRTVWSRWLEGIEARRLERMFSKADILEFYLNQVPYAARRRGVVQAARYYFDRDLDTLSPREMLALAVMVRAPGLLDLRRDHESMEKPLIRLARRMLEKKIFSEEEYQGVLRGKVSLADSGLPILASHFVNHVYSEGLDSYQSRGRLPTTLDASLQRRVQAILDSRLKDLRPRDVTNGAVLVVDYRTDEVLSWVNGGGGGFSAEERGSHIDAVTTPRQPGSTLKPLLYALALERGWTAATLINDSPLARPVGNGLHTYHNYSRENYGLVRLREALGNSLNIPAVRAVQFVGVKGFLKRLKELGFGSLTRHPDHYGEGLALGNGEVTLFELVRAYAVLARGGVFRPLILVRGNRSRHLQRRVYSREVSSIIADILSDPEARRLEFGNGNLLRFPTQTAVKTGTSTDYRDAWAVGFSNRYVVGVWMGNLDQKPMRKITGSAGPALALRAIFAELNRDEEMAPLYLSPGLKSVRICRISGRLATPDCPTMNEWFEPEKVPARTCPGHPQADDEKRTGQIVMAGPGRKSPIHLLQPTPGLQLAMDPRIPDEMEAFAFILSENTGARKVEWVVDGEVVASTEQNEFLWPLSGGAHTAMAKVWLSDESGPVETEAVRFYVK